MHRYCLELNVLFDIEKQPIAINTSVTLDTLSAHDIGLKERAEDLDVPVTVDQGFLKISEIEEGSNGILNIDDQGIFGLAAFNPTCRQVDSISMQAGCEPPKREHSIAIRIAPPSRERQPRECLSGADERRGAQLRRLGCR